MLLQDKNLFNHALIMSGRYSSPYTSLSGNEMQKRCEHSVSSFSVPSTGYNPRYPSQARFPYTVCIVECLHMATLAFSHSYPVFADHKSGMFFTAGEVQGPLIYMTLFRPASTG